MDESKRPKGIDPEQVAELYYRNGGNMRATARALECDPSTVKWHLTKLGLLNKPITGGTSKGVQTEVRKIPTSGVKRYILTSAQNNTQLFEPAYNNIRALVKHYGAEFLCASYSYNPNAYGKLSVKHGTALAHQKDEWHDERIAPLLKESDKQIELAPGLVWCGEMNIIPTAERPLRGLESYSGMNSAVFPHAKLAMQSIPSGKFEQTKFNYTTGTITKRNYIQKKSGLKAEHHHCYGAVLVEVDTEGDWFVRQLNADQHGVIYDLGLKAENGVVTSGNKLEAINWGDIHLARLNKGVYKLNWDGENSMIDTLEPTYQFYHDLIDFHARNHHNRGNCHVNFERHITQEDNVEEELRMAANFLQDTRRTNCSSVVVNSNHDNALEKWLRETDYRSDPKNALFFLKAQLQQYQAIAGKNSDFQVLEWSLRDLGCPQDILFLREDESFIICPNRSGGIESGMHGHLGPNGSRGSPAGLAKTTRRANTGHTHSAGIHDGLYTAAASADLDLKYNRGPSSWSHSHIFTYKNGKRTIITIRNNKWRA